MHARDRRKLLRQGGNLAATSNSAFSSQSPLVDRGSSFDASFTSANDIESPNVSPVSEGHSSAVPQFGHNFSNVRVHKDSPVPFVQAKTEADSEGESLSSEMVSDMNASKSSGDPLNENIGSRLGNSFGHDFSRVQIHAVVPETIQTKLTINQPRDVYEQEAEHVAEQVVNASQHPFQVQQQAAPQSASSPMLTSVQETLSSPGEPLTTGPRSQMERQFAHDFSRIRIHTDSRASASTYAVSGLAYTVGEDVVFRSGKYTPETTAGKRLLAHELTHVLQQEKMLQGKSLQEVGLPQDNPVVPQQMPPGINQPIAFLQRQGDNDNNGDDDDHNDQGGGGGGRGRSRQSRPVDAPPGTIPIDQVGLDKDKIHKIKDGVGVGPRDWVGISPEGHVIVTGDDGHAVDEGPADSYYREGVSMSKILEVLAILGISIFLAVEIAAAILDPEPASKLALLGLSSATIVLLLKMLGIGSGAQASQDTGTQVDTKVASADTNSSVEMMQTKLAVNQPGDVYEQEADWVADQVMQMAAPETSSISTEPVDDALEEKSLLCKEGGDLAAQGTASVPSSVNEVLSSNGGQPLDEETRAFMEPRFGHDFSRVRVHTDARAAESVLSVNTVAYTVGQDVVFGAGQYLPRTNEGRKLLAHELTHVVQQGSVEEIKNNITTVPAMRLQRQLITPLGQGGGFQGLMERDRDATTKSPDTGNSISIPEAIQGGWRQIRNLDVAILQTANIEQRLAMLAALIQAYWTGGAEEEAIIRILSTTPMTQSTELVKQLSEQTINGKPYLDELDRVVDLGNNLELHNVLSKLRLKAMGSEKGTKALEAAPILPWHDVMGFFEDAATFSFSRTSEGKVQVKYPARLFGSTDFGDELGKLPTDIFTSGHTYEPDQVLVIHDYDKGKFVPVVAQELLGYEHAGIRGFLGHVTTVASLAMPVGAAETALGKAAIFVLERLLPTVFLLVEENRLNLVKWFPTWGPKMIYYSDLAQMGVGLYGIARFATSGWKIFKSWKEIRQARATLEGAAVHADAEAEKVAAALEKQADEIFAEAEKIQSSEGEQVQAAASSGEPGAVRTESAEMGREAGTELSGSGGQNVPSKLPPHSPQNVLVVGAETESEFSYATEVASRGHKVTVINPQVTAEAKAYASRGGNFIQAPIETLPNEPAFDLIREDFPFPLGRAFHPTAEFARERLSRLAPGGRWVVVTEAPEFATTLEAVAPSEGVTVTVKEFPPFHEGAPQSQWPKEKSRFVLIFEKSKDAEHLLEAAPAKRLGTPGK